MLFCATPLLRAQDSIAVKDTVVPIWDMDLQVWREWDRIDSIWMHSTYWNLLAKHHLKMDCAHCERVSMQVDMQIDTSGRMISYKVIKSNCCGEAFSAQLIQEFMEFFEKYTFPPALRNLRFRTLLGTGLKC